jgi:phosphoglycolate phosphatase
MQKPHAVLFDWDNTLVDTWGVIHNAMNETLKHHDQPLWILEDLKKHAHQSSRDLFPDIFKDKCAQATAFFYEEINNTHLEQLEVLPYAKNLLEFLYEQNIPMAVISNKRSGFVQKEVAHLGWNSFFQTVIGSGDAPRDKPHADPILLALEKMQLQPSLNHWYVGDTITDWQAAQDSGCQPIALWTDPRSLTTTPDYYLPYLKDCFDLHMTVSDFLRLPNKKNIA